MLNQSVRVKKIAILVLTMNFATADILISNLTAVKNNTVKDELSKSNVEISNDNTSHLMNEYVYLSPKQEVDSNNCWIKAEQRYNVPAELLHAIAKVETNFRPNTIGPINKNGSYDIGLMQINSGWLPTLAKQGITKNDLFKPCTNIMVGAWILSKNITNMGYNWRAIGAYNAVTESKRNVYAKKIHKAIIELGYNK